jgi:diguanylate cyclase (GGDEF)-like protein
MDLTSLYLLFAFLVALGGALLLTTGRLSGAATLRWWSGAYFASAAGLAAIAVGHEWFPWLASGLGAGLILVGYGVMWAGIRHLAGMRTPPWQVAAAGAGWAAISAVLPLPPHAHGLRIVVETPFIEVMIGLLAVELLRLPGRPAARLPLLAVVGAHAAFCLVRAGALALGGAAVGGWLMASAVEGMAFLMCDLLLITHLVRALRESDLVAAADTDFLTGALNRRGFTAQAERCLRRWDCTLLVLDIDEFKLVNDTLGHAEGDRLLRELARICDRHVRPRDVVGRLGGDEFAILIAEGTEDTAAAIAQRIRHGFAQTRIAAGLAIGVSIGISGAKAGAVDLEELLRQADTRLYRAKDELATLALRVG